MDLLIDFANIVKWDREKFYGMADRLKSAPDDEYIAFRPSASGHLLRLLSGVLNEDSMPDIRRLSDTIGPFYISTKDGEDLPEYLICMVDASNSFSEHAKPTVINDEFLSYLGQLSFLWKVVLLASSEMGADTSFLTSLMTGKRYGFSPGKDPWNPVMGEINEPIKFMEDILIDAYVAPFLNAQGEIYKRIRICSDPDCGKLFVFNRPKQNFCNDECRYHFHNVVKTRNGYLAEHQRRGRKNNPTTYLRK